MVRVLFGGIAGAVVVYVFQWAAWLVLPIHEGTVQRLPQEEAVVDALRKQNLKTGVYAYPMPPEGADDDPNLMDEFTEKHREGPVFSIYYTQTGSEPMGPSVLLGGAVIDVLAGIIAAMLLAMTLPGRPSYWQRIRFVGLLGVLIALFGHAASWNWMHFPREWTVAMAADVIIAWVLAGAVIGAIVKPAPGPESEGES